MAATDVQTALAELDGDLAGKADTAHGHDYSTAPGEVCIDLLTTTRWKDHSWTTAGSLGEWYINHAVGMALAPLGAFTKFRLVVIARDPADGSWDVAFAARQKSYGGDGDIPSATVGDYSTMADGDDVKTGTWACKSDWRIWDSGWKTNGGLFLGDDYNVVALVVETEKTFDLDIASARLYLR